eukprot:TRINITY_DN7339_c0_g1_i1.p1 TRINITY_DN7339_c0_g1~~TRINITY_DN7339_c0_g1_i1.p1  ORF type:complete len:240 (+),score=46.04 TRINITY_DN7339_c0_g1_i1:277-996(+)
MVCKYTAAFKKEVITVKHGARLARKRCARLLTADADYAAGFEGNVKDNHNCYHCRCCGEKRMPKPSRGRVSTSRLPSWYFASHPDVHPEYCWNVACACHDVGSQPNAESRMRLLLLAHLRHELDIALAREPTLSVVCALVMRKYAMAHWQYECAADEMSFLDAIRSYDVCRVRAHIYELRHDIDDLEREQREFEEALEAASAAEAAKEDADNEDSDSGEAESTQDGDKTGRAAAASDAE